MVPTATANPNYGKDDIKDLLFTVSGNLVVRYRCEQDSVGHGVDISLSFLL